MSEEIIDSLLERAEEMLKRNYSRKIGAEEIITILKEYKKIQKENEELKERNKGLTTALEEWVNGERINDIKHISKDKIRDKIKNTDENIENLNNSYEFESAYVQAELNELRIKKQVLQELIGE